MEGWGRREREGEILTLMDACDSCGAGGWVEHSLHRLQHSSDFTARYFFFTVGQQWGGGGRGGRVWMFESRYKN